MDYDTGRRIDRKGRRILNTVVRFNKFNPEFSKIDRLSVADNFSLRRPKKIMLLYKSVVLYLLS